MAEDSGTAGTAETPSCPRCGGVLNETTVRAAIWQADRLAVVEDVPARVCSGCVEQYYDDDVSDALRVLNEQGFPPSEAERTIEVPVFSLKDRIRIRRHPPHEEFHVD